MSNDKKIGLFPDENPQHVQWLRWHDVSPILHNIKDCLPPGCPKEPEPKLLLPRPKCYMNIRTFFSASENAFMIPGQMHQDKDALTSLLLDTVPVINGHRFPAGGLAEKNVSLRARFEMAPETRNFSRRDFNEKTSNLSSTIVGGLADRDEREFDFDKEAMDMGLPLPTFKQGYERFIQHCRDEDIPAHCDNVPYEDLRLFGGYIAARTEYGFAVKHPKYPVLVTFEACEDRFDTYSAEMLIPTAQLCEFEFEAKQVWGELPHFAQSPEGFKLFLYSFMREIQDDLNARISGSIINPKSKADITKEHVAALYGDEEEVRNAGLAEIFSKIAPVGYNKAFTPFQYALSFGMDIDDTMAAFGHAIYQNGAKLHNEKLSFNRGSPQPHVELIRPSGDTVRQTQGIWRTPGLVLAAA